jgi:hypothetical protein
MKKFKKGDKLYLEVEFESYDKRDDEVIMLRIESSYDREFQEFVNPKLLRKDDLKNN